MTKYNELIQKLAKSPSWNETQRAELAAPLKRELARVYTAVDAKELDALAIELTAWWEQVTEVSLARPPLPAHLRKITQSLHALNLAPPELIALQLLVMDHRDRRFIATRTMNNNLRRTT